MQNTPPHQPLNLFLPRVGRVWRKEKKSPNHWQQSVIGSVFYVFTAFQHFSLFTNSIVWLGWLNKSSFFCSKFKSDLKKFSSLFFFCHRNQKGQIVALRPMLEMDGLFWQLAPFLSIRCPGRRPHDVASQSLAELYRRSSAHYFSASKDVHYLPNKHTGERRQLAAGIRWPSW